MIVWNHIFMSMDNFSRINSEIRSGFSNIFQVSFIWEISCFASHCLFECNIFRLYTYTPMFLLVFSDLSYLDCSCFYNLLRCWWHCEFFLLILLDILLGSIITFYIFFIYCLQIIIFIIPKSNINMYCFECFRFLIFFILLDFYCKSNIICKFLLNSSIIFSRQCLFIGR